MQVPAVEVSRVFPTVPLRTNSSCPLQYRGVLFPFIQPSARFALSVQRLATARQTAILFPAGGICLRHHVETS